MAKQRIDVVVKRNGMGFVKVDGKPLPNVQRVEVDAVPGEPPKVKLTMLADTVLAEGEVELPKPKNQ